MCRTWTLSYTPNLVPLLLRTLYLSTRYPISVDTDALSSVVGVPRFNLINLNLFNFNLINFIDVF